jgi:hypothetical protein
MSKTIETKPKQESIISIWCRMGWHQYGPWHEEQAKLTTLAWGVAVSERIATIQCANCVFCNHQNVKKL